MTPVTVEQAEAEHNAAVATSEQLQDRWLRGQCTFDELAAARQMAAHLGGRLEAMREREAVRREKAEAEAQRKLIEQKNRERAERFLETAPARLEAGEAISAAVLKAHAACKGTDVDAFRFVLGVVVETLRTEPLSPSSRGQSEHIRQDFLREASSDPLARLRKEITKAEETLTPPASTNGTKAKAPVTA